VLRGLNVQRVVKVEQVGKEGGEAPATQKNKTNVE
jgi:hypothetical protein